MKSFLLIALLTVSFGSSAMASSKVCFGSTKNYETKGVVLNVEIEAKDISIKTVKTGDIGDFEYNGKYPAKNKTIKGRDGVVYLTYDGEYVEYRDTIMVASGLLKAGTTGLLQIRSRGEGFFNYVFVCKDPS